MLSTSLPIANRAYRNELRLRGLLSPALAFVAVLSACVTLALTEARTEEGGTAGGAKALTFNIPAQPLASALQAFSQTSGVEVLYESKIVSGLHSVTVAGDLTQEAALQMLLGGHEITVRYTSRNAITLAVPQASNDLPPTNPLVTTDLVLGTLHVGGPDRPSTGLREYSDAVQADIEMVLRRSDKTRAGTYRVGVNLWVDPSRVVRKAELFKPTGDGERDTAIAGALQGLVISRPAPPNMPQPVRVVIVVRSL
jgi:hypothetical protein